MNRASAIIIAMLTASLVAGAAMHAQQPAKKAEQKDESGEVLGKWIGAVSADVGEMPIQMELKKEGTKIVGQIPSMHGSFTVTDVRKADGKWTIAFKADDGATGKMIGALKDGKLVGDWDFRPRALGKFQLRRKAAQPKN